MHTKTKQIKAMAMSRYSSHDTCDIKLIKIAGRGDLLRIFTMECVCPHLFNLGAFCNDVISAGYRSERSRIEKMDERAYADCSDPIYPPTDFNPTYPHPGNCK